MAKGQTEHDADAQPDGRQAMKRRGLIAGAAALVAGMVAKQTAMPVAAASTPVIFATDGLGSPENHPVSAVYIDDESFTNTGPGPSLLSLVTGTTSPTRPGIGGLNVRFTNGSEDSVGVSSFVSVGTGLYGESSGNALSKAVHGKHDASGYGVYGEALASMGYGVTGVSTNAFGVLGQSTNSIGVQGECDVASGIGVKGISASGFPIFGQISGGTNTNAAVGGLGTAGPGVQGQSAGGYGLVGFTSDTHGHAGLIGFASAAGGIGLIGNAPGGVSPGLAGVFNGDVIVNGALRVYGSPKNAAVKHPGDGTYRLLYCEEATESWFADYGRGTLSGDKADITLDPDFAALVHVDDYHVFLTAHGPQHLHVAQQSATGFSVVATAIGGAVGGPKLAEGGGTFSWRVVAKRKDIAGERLAKVAPPPPLKPVTPFTVPATPATKPPKQP